MRGLNSRSFFWQWQALYSASNPDHQKDSWEVDGVSWTKERHAYWGTTYSVQLEVHRLERKNGAKLDWHILVVIERWWGPDRKKCLRDTSWSKLIGGRPERVLGWLRKQEVPPLSALAAQEIENSATESFGE
jgi:hypothetical protein